MSTAPTSKLGVRFELRYMSYVMDLKNMDSRFPTVACVMSDFERDIVSHIGQVFGPTWPATARNNYEVVVALRPGKVVGDYISISAETELSWKVEIFSDGSVRTENAPADVVERLNSAIKSAHPSWSGIPCPA